MTVLRTMVAATILSPLLGQASVAETVPVEPVEIGTTAQFVFDQYLIDNHWAIKYKNETVRRVFHQPEKYEHNPVIAGEGGYICVLKDEDDGLFRMWYQTWIPSTVEGESGRYAIAYGESEDGISWTLPKLGLHEWKGSLARQNADCVNPTSDLGVEFYAQGGVVVDGIAYFTSDDGGCVKTGIRSPGFHSVVAFDVHTLRKVRTYHFGQTYDSSPFLFRKRDGTWLVIAHEHKNRRTMAFQRDHGHLEWTSVDNQPGNYFFGYTSYRLDDGKQLILMACRNGLHAMSGETGEDVWWRKEKSTGGVTPCVDQERGWIFYQCNGKVLKVRATDGEVLQSVSVGSPNVCISWNTVLVNDVHGYFVATRWYGRPEWDSALRVFDKDLNLIWERTGLPIGKKDTLTYVDGKLVTGSGNHWSKKYEGDKWKYVAAYSIADGSILWKCDLSHIAYESLFNLPYFNGHFYAETTGGDYGTSKLLRIRASDGALVEMLDYGRSISSCAPCIIAHGKLLSGDLGEDRIVVTKIAENSALDWPGPFGDPQTNTFALTEDPDAKPVAMREVRPKGKAKKPEKLPRRHSS